MESKEKIENNNIGIFCYDFSYLFNNKNFDNPKQSLGIFFIYYFTPCHYFISRYFSEYVNYLIKANGNKNEFYSTTNIVIISVVFFINL